MTEQSTPPARLLELHNHIQSRDPATLMSEMEGVTPADHQLIGALIQLMAFIDFNARRAFRALLIAAKAEDKAARVARMPDSQVLSGLAAAIEAAAIPFDEQQRARAAMGLAMELATLRHHAAHWATLRFPHDDAFLMMTMNAREGSKRTGGSVDEDEMVYAIVPLPKLRLRVAELAQASDELSVLAADWVNRFVETPS